MASTSPELVPPPPDHELPSAHEVDPDNRIYQQPVSGRGPALIVLGIAVFIVVLGLVASAISTGGGSATPAVSTVTVPGGTVVHLTLANQAMKSILSSGQPPADIMDNLAVPAGSTVLQTVSNDGGVSQFDRTVSFQSDLSSDVVVAAYRALFPKLGWHILSDGPYKQGATLVLAKRASSDSFYWEAGVVVSPTTSAGTTPFSVEVFELPDDN
jgi:hypothetical protein